MIAFILLIVISLPTQALAAASTAVTDSQLSSTIAQHLLNQDRTFSLTLANKAELKQLDTSFNLALESNDYVHYIYSGYRYSAKETKSGTIDIKFTITYLETKAQTAYVLTEVKKILKEIIKPNMTDFQKEKAIHDYVITHVAYDTSLVNYSAYEALTKGKTVCQGFALLTYRLLDEAGIKNQIVEGYAGGRSHAWNLVQIKGNWYQLDTTWDNPVPFKKGRILDTYFNLTDAELQKDHSWIRSNYPAANTTYNDKTVIKTVAKKAVVTTVQELQKQIETAMAKKQVQVSIQYKLASRNLIKDLQSAVVNKEDLGVKNVEYSAKKGTDGIITLELYFKYA
jgi:hypothetical protein